MSALAADRRTMRRNNLGQVTRKAGVARLYGGALACYDGDGHVQPASATSGYVLAGVVYAQVDNRTGLAGGADVVLYEDGEFLFGISGSVAQADVGAWAYIVDDQTVTLTAPVVGVRVGRLRGLEYAGLTLVGVWVDIQPGTRSGQLYHVTLTGPLTAAVATTGGSVLSLANPFGERVIVKEVLLDITTKTSGSNRDLNVGVAANGTTSSDTLIDGLAIGTAAGVADNLEEGSLDGGNGRRLRAWGVTEYITATPSASAAGLVGTYYITCLVQTAR